MWFCKRVHSQCSTLAVDCLLQIIQKNIVFQRINLSDQRGYWNKWYCTVVLTLPPALIRTLVLYHPPVVTRTVVLYISKTPPKSVLFHTYDWGWCSECSPENFWFELTKSMKLLKYIPHTVIPIIIIIFNKSLPSSIYQSVWKLAIVRPLQKCSYFQFISIRSALSKYFERLVHQQVYSFPESNEL